MPSVMVHQDNNTLAAQAAISVITSQRVQFLVFSSRERRAGQNKFQGMLAIPSLLRLARVNT